MPKRDAADFVSEERYQNGLLEFASSGQARRRTDARRASRHVDAKRIGD